MSRDDATLPDAAQRQRPARQRPVLALKVVAHPAPDVIGRSISPPDGASLTIGRGGSALGPGGLDDPLLSRRHLQLSQLQGRLWAEDPGSLNGSWLNGARFQRAALAPGDVIGIGGILMVACHSTPGARWPRSARLLGESEALGRAIARIEAAAPTDAPVLLTGETGTGKELAARELHERSGRAGPLLAINCGAMEPGVIASELFGHVRGAYSGASGSRPGLIEAARGGTLLLDEIGDAPPKLQVSLLRLLQEGEYRPVGSDRIRRSEARLVAATHRDLHTEVAAGRFRQDLLARLSRWPIVLPPLRERREDTLLLARHFIELTAGRPLPMHRALSQAILLHSWPMNVRGLAAAVERLVIESGGAGPLELPDWLELEAKHTTAALLRSKTPPQTLPQAPPLSMEPEQPTQPVPPRRRPRRPSAEALQEGLERCDGNVKALAEELNVGRTTLYRWMKALGIEPDAVRASMD